MTDAPGEAGPAAVPTGATQAGEAHEWTWVEPTVWTARMVAALDEGVRGGVWFSLIDKVHRRSTLAVAFTRVKANGGAAGVDHVTVAQFEADVDGNLARLSESLRDGTYRPQAIRRVWIPKPGSREKRPLGIPTVRDRVVQTAVRLVLEPIFERDFAAHSYGFRPKRGCKDALRRVQTLLEAGYTHVVDADLQRYFDSIPHAQLMARVRTKVADGRVLALLEAFLGQAVLEPLATWTPEEGTPQGAVISPLLANIYLDPLDHEMAERGYEMVRYADDLVVLCQRAEAATTALDALRAWTAAQGLTLHPTKTRVVDATQPGGFDFLGYHFERGKRWPRTKSLRKLKATIRAQTPRTSGHSLAVVIAKLNATLRGWFGYFKHSAAPTFRLLDQMVRQRLRAILKKRRGRRGVARGADFQRWPNAFFAAQGLYSLVAAHAAARHSSRR